MKQVLLHEDITGKIIKAFFNVYNELGYGFLEKVYERAMLYELQILGLNADNQTPVKVEYKNKLVGDYFADIIVEEKVIIELKAVENIISEHEVQLVNYLKATNIEVGLLLNFGPKPQYKRRVLTEEYKNAIKNIDADER
ncbi:MAG TPA: GxxExxY protein [Bacteroidales bacterium]|nr:GxxExxY protein [Bacteroidales bacterium]HPS18039.1 GxxExxY protein [Bacteroidales bacterium]